MSNSKSRNCSLFLNLVKKQTYTFLFFPIHSFHFFFFLVSTLPLQVEDAGRSEALIAARDQEEQALVAKITQLESKANPSPAEKDQLQKLKAERETFKKYVRVEQNTRLDNRILDLRVSVLNNNFK